MRYEYHQEKYRTDGKRFHPELNKMGRKGWVVQDMHHTSEGIVLVTFARPYPTDILRETLTHPELADKDEQMSRQGWKAEQIVHSGSTQDGEDMWPIFLVTWRRNVLPAKPRYRS